MGVEEGLAVELLNVQDGGAFQAAAQGLLGPTLVSNERLKHSPYHVELRGKKREAAQCKAIMDD